MMLKTINIELELPSARVVLSLALPYVPDSVIDFHHQYTSNQSGIHFHCVLHPDNLDNDIQKALMDQRVNQNIDLCLPYVLKAANLIIQLIRQID
jgi:hypothetical protein